VIPADVMQAIADQLNTIAGLRCFAWPPGTVTPPAAVVGYPERCTFDETYGRGMDLLTVPVVVIVGPPYQRQARAAFSAYTAGSGASSVKAVLESGTYTAFDAVRVASWDQDVYRLAGVDYLAAIFELQIGGKGT